jgi:hypothetical protein
MAIRAMIRPAITIVQPFPTFSEVYVAALKALRK